MYLFFMSAVQLIKKYIKLSKEVATIREIIENRNQRIEIQDFKAAFVNLTRNDCFICLCHCVCHLYVINCVRLLAIIIHCSMFSYSHWSFFSPNLLEVSKIS